MPPPRHFCSMLLASKLGLHAPTVPLRSPVFQNPGNGQIRSPPAHDQTRCQLYIGSISASLTACPLRGYGRAGAQNNRLGPARPYPRNGQAVGDAEMLLSTIQ